MPIKLPKGFQRRKSSGHALEEVQNPPEPSFRVFERPSAGDKSFDGGHVLRKPVIAIEERPVAAPSRRDEDESDQLFPASRMDLGDRRNRETDKSVSSRTPYDSAASSARLSSSSTIPSSTDAQSDVGGTSKTPRPFQDIPVPPKTAPRPPFLQSSDRAFSFESRASDKTPAPCQAPPVPYHHATSMADGSRERAFSASTTSTATPPKLLDSDIALGDSDGDGFSNMFDNIGERTSRFMSVGNEKQPQTSTAAPLGVPDYLRQQRLTTPSPPANDKFQIFGSSPYSYTSQDSEDGLIRSPSPMSPDAQEKSLPSLPRKAVPASQSTQKSTSTRAADALAAAASVDSQKETQSAPRSPEERRRPSTDLALKRQQGFQQAKQRFERLGDKTQSANPTVLTKSKSRASNNSEGPSSPISPTLATGALLAAEWEQREEIQPINSTPVRRNKVMTPAQFERYRQEQEMDRRRAQASKGNQSDDDSDDYEDEDEAERDRKATEQRRKQEAHLAVYRQTMMKVTGEQPSKRSGSTDRLGARQPSSTSLDNLTKSTSSLTLDPMASPVNGKSSGEEDEDDDIPLGILAAHGFPNKNRPPTRLSNQTSNPNLRVASGATSAAGDVPQGPRGNLPVFAKRLPQDPYYGASLVNPSNRESFAMGGGASVKGVPLPGVPANAHPAGLVGVIAGEERARAMRRGSPNAQGAYEMPGGMAPAHPGMLRSQTMSNMPMGYTAPGMVPGMALPLTPADQAQIQISQQMNQMMQVQMQWMQQMSQMLQGQGQVMAPQLPQPPRMSPDFLAPPGQIQRPMSMPIPESEGQPRPGQRTMSSLTPGMAPWNRPANFAPTVLVSGPGIQGYTPSIAPSERSNVGLSARYRPVSIAPAQAIQPVAKRASTFTAGTPQPWANTDSGRRSKSPGAGSSLRPVGEVERGPAVPDDDEDDEGWREMKQKRDKKKSNWKMKRAQTQDGGLGDLYHG